jgi:apolipoprotein D and lipocalin family protein
MKIGYFKLFFLILLGWCMAGCAGTTMRNIETVKQVDLPSFMGDWYVIAAIPTMIETQAYNAIENYKLNDDGTIATTFTYYKGSYSGAFKKYQPKGYIKPNTGNALWGMQFIWPFQAEYRVAYLDRDYQYTIIARNQRDYVWIMARTPQIPDAEYKKLTDFVTSLGYDLSKLRKVPQQWINR